MLPTLPKEDLALYRACMVTTSFEARTPPSRLSMHSLHVTHSEAQKVYKDIIHRLMPFLSTYPFNE